MKNFIYLLWFTFFLMLIAACKSNTKFDPGASKISPLGLKDHRLVFFKLDDYAKIIINGNVVHDTSENGLNPNGVVEIDLNSYLQEGKYDLTVELYNARCDDCTEGNSWEVNYEYYVNGELHDYVSEMSESEYLPIGLSYSKKYEGILFTK